MRGTVFSLTQTSTCPWKGTASSYDVIVGEQVNKDAAWYYRQVSDSGQASDGTECGCGATGRGGIGGRPRAMLGR